MQAELRRTMTTERNLMGFDSFGNDIYS